mmetsp:Transcript_22066/g.41585  ORF Transcript_22066/g.41585 Transcript_22066/m.41585 type:complete len:215 (-) Transcript_22066:114-758(-)
MTVLHGRLSMMLCRRRLYHASWGGVHRGIHRALNRSDPSTKLVEEDEATPVFVETVEQRLWIHDRAHPQQGQAVPKLTHGQPPISVCINSLKDTEDFVEINQIPQQHREFPFVDPAVLVQVARLVCSHQCWLVVELWICIHNPAVDLGQADNVVSVVVKRFPSFPKRSFPRVRSRCPVLKAGLQVVKLAVRVDAGAWPRSLWEPGAHLRGSCIG